MIAPTSARARLLVLTSTYPRWPDDTLPPFVHELARRLTGEFEVQVLAPHASGCKTHEVMDGVEVRRFRYLPERFETLAYSSGMLPGLRRRPWRLLVLPLFLAAECWATWRLLRKQRYAAIHAHWILPHGLVALLARRLCGYRPALVCTSHGADLYGLKGRLARTLKRYTVAQAQHVTVVSQAMLQTLTEETGITAHCSVLPMGVDTRERFVLPASTIKRDGLLFAGRLADKKGVSVLLEAMARMKDMQGLSLHIIGSGPEEQRLQLQAHTLGLTQMVDFLGPLPNRDLPPWYQKSAILAFPSVVTEYGDQEGLGLVPVEALACGCAVVASDLSAVRDVIRHDETGLLVPAGDATALADTLQNLLRDKALRERLASQGRTYVQEQFDWDRIAARYAALFRGLNASAAETRVTSP